MYNYRVEDGNLIATYGPTWTAEETFECRRRSRHNRQQHSDVQTRLQEQCRLNNVTIKSRRFNHTGGVLTMKDCSVNLK